MAVTQSQPGATAPTFKGDIINTNPNPHVQQSADLLACGFASTQITSTGGLFNNGHVAIAKDLIFGLCIWDGDQFVPLSEGDQSELDLVRGLINKGTHPFLWWTEFDAVKTRS